MKRFRFDHINRIYEIFIYLMSFIVAVLIATKLFSIVLKVPGAVKTLSPEAFDTLITEILTFFVLIELAKAFTEYLEFKRVRLHIMAEIASIFAIRELLISLYKQNFDWLILISFSLLILSLTIVRSLSIKYRPYEELKRRV